jgi:hypothetical protein
MSFHTQSGPVLYSRGGSLKSALAWADSVAPHNRAAPNTHATMATASSRPMAEFETHNPNVWRDFISRFTLPAKLPRGQARYFQRVQNGADTSFANGEGGAGPMKQHQTLDRPFTDWMNLLA